MVMTIQSRAIPYPEMRDIALLESLPPDIRQFLSDACQEDHGFLTDYLVPTLGRTDARETIFEDLSNAIADHEIGQLGLGEFGDLGKSFFKRVGKAIKKVAKKVGRATGVKVVEKVAKAQQKLEKRAVKEVEKVYRKDGDAIVGAVGAVLAPFTGGLSVAAASLITGAHAMYRNKKAAEKAKKQNNQAAGQLATQAQQSEAQTTQQVNAFYTQNQSWFQSQGISQAQWNGMSLDQKINTINSGASGSLTPVSSAPQAQPQTGPVPQDSGGGPADSGADSGYAPSGSAQGPAQPIPASPSGGMSSMILPAAAIVAAAIIFSGGSRSSGRTRRNPSRSRRSGLGRGKRSTSRRGW